MADVVILSDVFTTGNISKKHANERIKNPESLNKWNFWSRYLGPYAIKQTIEDNTDLSVLVLDYFTKIEDFFVRTKNVFTEDTKFIGISTTFLHNIMNRRIGAIHLWYEANDELYDWLTQIKQQAPNAKIFIGGHACDTFYQNHVDNRIPLP